MVNEELIVVASVVTLVKPRRSMTSRPGAATLFAVATTAKLDFGFTLVAVDEFDPVDLA